MKFQKTINLWADGIQDAIASGSLKIQVGQWVKCGVLGQPARYAGITSGGTLLVQHEQGCPRDNAVRFEQLRTLGKQSDNKKIKDRGCSAVTLNIYQQRA